MSLKSKIEKLTCSSLIKQIRNFTDEEILNHVLTENRICHFNPSELAKLAIRAPVPIVKNEILKRAQAPTFQNSKQNSEVWTIESIERVLLAFKDDPDVQQLASRKINTADIMWFRDASTDTLISILQASNDKKRILQELAMRRYSLNHQALETIINTTTPD